MYEELTIEALGAPTRESVEAGEADLERATLPILEGKTEAADVVVKKAAVILKRCDEMTEEAAKPWWKGILGR